MPSLDGMASEDARDTDTRKLVILGLPWDTTETSLEQYFSQMGPLQVPVLPAAPRPSCPPLFHGCTCGSTHVRCEDFPFPLHCCNTDTCKLVVLGLPWDTTEARPGAVLPHKWGSAGAIVTRL